MGPRPHGNNPRGYAPPVRKPITGANTATKKPQMSSKELRKLQKARRREKDYFYVMRKGICLIIFIFCLVVVAVSDVGFLPMDLPIDQFTAVLVKPDYTPQNIRDAATTDDTTEDSEEEASEYIPKDVYISFADLVYGAAAQLKLMEAPESALVGVEFYNETLDIITQKAEGSEDMLTKLAPSIFKFVPLVAAVAFNLLIISLFFALFSMFGRRVFRFGLVSLIVLVTCVALLAFGLAANGAYVEAVAEDPSIIDDPSETEQNILPAINAEDDGEEDPADGEESEEEEAPPSLIDFANLMPFISGAFPSIPATEAEVVPGAPVVTAGIGFLALLGGGILVFVFSLFARKKIPYAIFDR
jgi:hypothetical protein